VVRGTFLAKRIGGSKVKLAVNAISQFRHFATSLDAPRATHHDHESTKERPMATLKWMFVVFVGVFAWQVGTRLSEDALSMVVGVTFGALASVPAALLVVVVSRRQQEARLERMEQERTRPQAWREPNQTPPPVIVLTNGGAPGSYAPQQGGYAEAGYDLLPPPRPNRRQFQVIGEEDGWLDQDAGVG
jgi:hypothetical protein